MNKQDEEKAREIANQSPVYFMHIYFGCLEMAAWKEQQMIEKAVEWLEEWATHQDINGVEMIEDFKKTMKGE